MTIIFPIAKEQIPGTISRGWIAKYLNRSESFVKRNWNGDLFNCESETFRPTTTRESLSQESKDIITETLGREKKKYQ